MRESLRDIIARLISEHLDFHIEHRRDGFGEHTVGLTVANGDKIAERIIQAVERDMRDDNPRHDWRRG